MTTDAKTIEHEPQPDRSGIDETERLPQQPEAQPEAAAPPLAEPEQQTPLSTRAALIPVGPTGATPMTMAQQIDFGQYMAKARAAIPQHLQGNVGDCLAVIDIASRAGLSPYMVANKTYVQNGRLAFESQLFHALLVQSGVLKGDLETTWQGEGDEMTCTVTGTLRSDGKKRSHTSEKLSEARPPMNSSGLIKGSPLWKDKPKVQLFYDTSRDWTRMYAPTATLGIYTPDEMIEHPIRGPDGAIEVRDTDPSLHRRLQGTSRAEGHQPGHAESELANVGAGGDTKIKAVQPTPARSAQAQTARRTTRAQKRAERASARPTAKATPSAQKVEKGQKGAKTPTEPEKSPIQTKAEREQAAAPNGKPKTAVEYWGFARAWITAAPPKGRSADDHAGDLEGRWDDERELRDELAMPVARRKEMEKLLTERCVELRGE